MRAVFMRLWSEEDAAVVSAEIMIIATILVIGMIVGLKSVRDSVVTELADVAAAFDSANPYSNYGNSNGYNNGGWGGGGWSGGGWGGDSWGGGSGSGINTAAGAMGES